MNKHWLRFGLFLATLGLFIFLRVFRIDQSFDLFSDLARDLFKIQEWSNRPLHPPLLGPQTSVVSFNQSAIYFYYLFPFFLLMNHSVYSTLVASIFLYLVVFGWLWWWYRENPVWQWRLNALIFLIAIHPQFVLQHRYVWNPSLVAPFLILSLWAWLEYQKTQKQNWIWGMVVPLAVAASLNFSILPTVAMFLFFFIWQERKKVGRGWKALLYGGIAGVVLNFPTLIFEIRHNFLLTKSLPTKEIMQPEGSLWNRILLLSSNIVWPTISGSKAVWLYGFLVFSFLGILFISKKYFIKDSIQRKTFLFAWQIFVGSTLLLLSTPFKMHKHFMFGVLTFFLLTVISLPKKFLWPILLGATVLYLQPKYFLLYQEKALHTVVDKTQCARTFCEDRLEQGKATQPIFINTHSSSYNHQALEYVFLLKEFGCAAINTHEFNAAPVDEMLVVADRANFENGKTDYYELSQFGEATEIKKYECKPDLKLHLLQRN